MTRRLPHLDCEEMNHLERSKRIYNRPTMFPSNEYNTDLKIKLSTNLCQLIHNNSTDPSILMNFLVQALVGRQLSVFGRRWDGIRFQMAIDLSTSPEVLPQGPRFPKEPPSLRQWRRGGQDPPARDAWRQPRVTPPCTLPNRNVHRVSPREREGFRPSYWQPRLAAGGGELGAGNTGDLVGVSYISLVSIPP